MTKKQRQDVLRKSDANNARGLCVIAHNNKNDTEAMHHEIDQYLIDMLRSLGYEKTAHEAEVILQACWYS